MKIYIAVLFICFTSCRLSPSRIIPFPMEDIKHGTTLTIYSVTVYHIKAKKKIQLHDLINYPKAPGDKEKVTWMFFKDYSKKNKIIKLLTQYSYDGPAIVPYDSSNIIYQLIYSNKIFFSGYYPEHNNLDGPDDIFFSKLFFLNPDTKTLYELSYIF